MAPQPGEARTVSIAVPAQRFAARDATAHAWRIGAGRYGLSAAASSRDPRAVSQTVTHAAH
nr:fibronectin type III-like domain-contianing protein [Burkholderia sp. LA-2-3-30-S1-D2]